MFLRYLCGIVAGVCFIYMGSIQSQEPKINNQIVEELEEVQVTAVEKPPVKFTKAINPQELQCLALNIYHEARGESIEGKFAVAHVTVNRVNSLRFPDTVCAVVYQAVYSTWWQKHHNRKVPVRNRCHFSWYCDGKSDEIIITDSSGKVIEPNLQAWKDSIFVAKKVLRKESKDLTNGATHYYNPDLANPYWRKHYVRVATVDNHAFYR